MILKGKCFIGIKSYNDNWKKTNCKTVYFLNALWAGRVTIQSHKYLINLTTLVRILRGST